VWIQEQIIDSLIGPSARLVHHMEDSAFVFFVWISQVDVEVPVRAPIISNKQNDPGPSNQDWILLVDIENGLVCVLHARHQVHKFDSHSDSVLRGNHNSMIIAEG
jgi:hypothetical protein